MLSFDHPSPNFANTSTEVQLPEATLTRLAGTDKAKDDMELAVTPSGNRLMVAAAGSTYELLPQTATQFFMTQRRITVTFTLDQAGKGQAMVVRDKGAIVAEAAVVR